MVTLFPVNEPSTSSSEIERLKIAMETSGVGTWELQLPANVISWDENCRKLFGIKKTQQLSYQQAINYIHPEDLVMVDVAVKAALSGKDNGIFDARYRTIGADDNILRWVRFTGRAFFDEAGNPLHMNGIAQDITEIVNSNQKAFEAQSLARVALEASNAGSFRVLLETDELEYSPALAKIFTGDETSKVSRQDLINRIAPQDHAGRKQAFLRAVKTGNLDYEARVIWDDGSMHWVHIVGTFIKVAGGNTPQIFTGTVKDITNDKKNRDEAGMRENDARFRLLIEQAPVATCLFVGREMKIEIANETMINFWGKGSGVMGRKLAEVVPELEGQPFLQILDEVYTTGKAFEAKAAYAQLEVDGKLGDYYFDFTYKPIRDTNGEVYGIMDTAVDVTEQVIYRRKLEESEQFATSIFHNSPVAKIVFVGEDMTIKTVNENMLVMLGRDASIVGRGLAEAIPELGDTPLLDRYHKVLHAGETFYQMEEPFWILKQGKLQLGYYNYIYKGLKDTSGKTYGVMCTATDVTEQVLARQKVEEAELSLRAAIELAELATWRIDFSTNRIHHSERLMEWFGFASKEENLEDALLALDEQDRLRLRNALNTALSPESTGILNEVYTVANRVNGQKRIIHARGKTVYDSAGQLINMNGTARDITIQRELQLALQQEVKERTEELGTSNEKLQVVNHALALTNKELATTNNQLLHSNEELAQFAYVASHDLQEPLRKIMLFSDMLDQRENVTDAGKSLVNKIKNSAERMSLLIRDLLDFSRLLKTDRLFQPVDLNDVVAAVVNDFEIIIEEKNASVNVDAMPVLQAVSLQMNQLFYNLLNNALKFSKAGVPPVINIRAALMDREEAARYISHPSMSTFYHHITVSDNGIGFEPAYADHIFEVFKRLHGREFYPGSGIGLALCRRIVVNHNGNLYAESVVDEGSTFHIVLPG